jgi:hypothetical protein
VSTIHLSTPADPKTAVCGDPEAKHFVPWRWKVTCATCKMVSAPRPLDAQKVATVRYRSDLPIRYSALVANVRRAGLPGAEEAIAEFERERQIAARCAKHGLIADPIALFAVQENRIVFGCPDCTTGPERERWEREGR